jgi:transcriptional regulator with XRE-family HTH domain
MMGGGFLMIDGDRLRELRKDKRLTQQKLAAIILKGKGSISRYEKGIRQPDMDTLARLADFFGVSVDYLLGRTRFPKILEKMLRHVLVNDLSEADVEKVRTYVDFLRAEKAKQK